MLPVPRSDRNESLPVRSPTERPDLWAADYAIVVSTCLEVIGICRSGIGLARNSRRQIAAVHRAHRLAVLRRALSVAMPVLAYICR